MIQLYVEQKLSDSEIAKLYRVSNGRVHRLRNHYGIAALEYYQRHRKQELSHFEKQLLVGTLLGDGHMRCRDQKDKRAYPQLMLEQTVHHIEYIKWLRSQFKDWVYNPNKALQKNCKNHYNGKKYTSYSFQTVCHPVFNEFYKGFYQNKNKNLNVKFIEKYFSPVSLAVWLMDDGTKKSDDRIIICSHGFSKMENQKLSEMLENLFDIKSGVYKTGRGYYYITLQKDSSKLASRLVKPYIIKSMQYKLVK